MEAESVAKLIQLLHSELCNLPCYLGITPGQTTWDESRGIFEDLGAFISFDTEANGLTVHNIHLDIGDDSLANITPDPDEGVTNRKIIQSLHILVKDGIIQKLWTSISTRRFTSRFHEHWSRYSLREILQRHGVPDQIVLGTPTPGGTGVGFVLIYDQKGIVAELWDEIQDDQICPGPKKISASLQLTVTNTFSGVDIYEPGGVPPTNREVYLPIEEVLGVNKEDFYNEVLTDPSVCFEVKGSK